MGNRWPYGCPWCDGEIEWRVSPDGGFPLFDPNHGLTPQPLRRGVPNGYLDSGECIAMSVTRWMVLNCVHTLQPNVGCCSSDHFCCDDHRRFDRRCAVDRLAAAIVEAEKTWAYSGRLEWLGEARAMLASHAPPAAPVPVGVGASVEAALF